MLAEARGDDGSQASEADFPKVYEAYKKDKEVEYARKYKYLMERSTNIQKDGNSVISSFLKKNVG